AGSERVVSDRAQPIRQSLERARPRRCGAGEAVEEDDSSRALSRPLEHAHARLAQLQVALVHVADRSRLLDSRSVATDRLKELEEKTRYSASEVERRIFERWEESGIFHPEPEGTADANYSIAIPPPNVTGALHMGHALNGSIQDALIRLKRMQGRRTKWIFGTDHAGIATQVQVERQLVEEGTSRQEIGREAFNERVWKW